MNDDVRPVWLLYCSGDGDWWVVRAGGEQEALRRLERDFESLGMEYPGDGEILARRIEGDVTKVHWDW